MAEVMTPEDRAYAVIGSVALGEPARYEELRRLVLAALRAAITQEREACIQAVEDLAADETEQYAAAAYEGAIAAIRARGPRPA